MRKLLLRLLQAGALVAFVVGQLWPGGVGTPSAWNPVGHVLMYAAMVVLFWPDLAGLKVWQRVAVMVLAGLLLGTVFELLQGQVPGRAPEVADVVADLVGVGLGLGLAWVGGILAAWWRQRASGSPPAKPL